MIRLLDKPNWNIDTNIAYTLTATVPALVSNLNALEAPFDAVPGGYFTALLNNFVTLNGGLSAYISLDRTPAYSGDITTSLIFRELGSNPYLSKGYKFSVSSSPQILDTTTYMHDRLLTADVNSNAQIITLSTTSDYPICSFILKEYMYDAFDYSQIRVSYYDNEDATKIVVDYNTGSEFSLICEANVRSVDPSVPLMIKGTSGIDLRGDAGGNEASSVARVDFINVTDEPFVETYLADDVFTKDFADSNLNNILISSSTDIGVTYNSTTGPDGSTITAVRFTNNGVGIETFEITIPIIDLPEDEVELIFKSSAFPINIGFKHRINTYDDIDFYFNKIEIDALGAIDGEIYRAEESTFIAANSQLVNISPNNPGPTLNVADWIGIKSSTYNSNFIRSRIQYVDITSPSLYGQYSTLIDINDNMNGINSTYLSMFDKCGYATILVELQPSEYIDIAEINRIFI